MRYFGKRKKAKQRNPLKDYHWVKRFVKEMVQNEEVQRKVIDGKLDKYLK